MPMRKRFRRHRTRAGKPLPPIAIVGIVLASAVLLTVIVGNLLHSWLDDDTYNAIVNGIPEPTTTEVFTPVSVRNVHAYPFSLGGDLTALVGQTSASVALNTPNGELTYESAVGNRYSLPMQSNAPLAQSMGELCTLIPYTSGIFYPQAPKETNDALRYATIGEECALLNEFILSGGNEILICGLSLTPESAEASINYLKQIKHTAKDVPVGVAVPVQIASDQANWELLARLLETVDFCALDFTDQPINTDEVDEAGISVVAKALFEQTAYARSAYSMRPLFAETQEALIAAAISTDMPTFQVVRK